MPINVILRFSWIVNTVGLPLGSQVLGFMSGALEVYRRFQWNFFRLENEHLNNCGQFRAIKEIPLPFSVIEETASRRGSEIRLPTDDTERYPEQELTNVSRHNTLKKISSRASTSQGTFYGRRDFESKRDDDADAKGKPSDGVFNRITNLGAASPDSDSEDDDDDDDEGAHSDQ
jgi:EXS family